MKNTIIATLVLITVIVLIVLMRNTLPGKGLSFNLQYASSPAVSEAPLHAAMEKGFFEEEGIAVDAKFFQDGKTALFNLFEDKVQLAGVMATPVVRESFSRSDFRVIAVVEHPSFHHLLVNINHITGPQDLTGKKIGVTRGTSGEYFMHAYFKANEIDPDDLEIYDLIGEELVTAMIDHEIDAMFSWDHYTSEVKKKLGQQVVFLDNQQMIPPSWVVVGKTQFILENHEVIESFLRGLQKGVRFANTNPEELISIHTRTTKKNNANLNANEIRGKFQLSLTQELLLDMEKQAHWLISKHDSLTHQLPNFLSLIYTEAIRSVSPQTVTLIK